MMMESFTSQGLSLALSEVLTDVGVCEENREITRDRCLMYETVQTLWNEMKGMDYLSEYIFGSQAEASTTIGLQSDVDKLTCNESIPVVQDIPAVPPNGKCLLVVHDKYTPPGYVKLQIFEDGTPCTTSPGEESVFCLDNGRALLSNKIGKYKPTLTRNEFVDSTSGPAVTTQVDGYTLDVVRAYRCKTWPTCASEWFERSRPYDWPPSELIARLKTLGFFFAPVGHSMSKDQDKEWRISLSLQEKLLVQHFNQVQMKCYVLWKFIKKDIIAKQIPGKSISSYHLKTCLFYVIENTPANVWVPENLLHCFQKCLVQITEWVEKGFCPNFFVPEENMFSRHVDSSVRKKLLPVLQGITSSDFQFLFELNTDELGRRLRAKLRPDLIAPDTNTKETAVLKTATEKMAISIWYSKLFLAEVKYTDTTTCVQALEALVTKIKGRNSMLEYTEEETKEGLNNILPYLETSLLTQQAAQSLKQHGSCMKVRNMLSRKNWDTISFNSDYLTAELKQAILLFATGDKRLVLDILIALEQKSLLTVSNCICRGLLSVRPLDSKTIEKIGKRNLSSDEIYREVFSPCISFLPTVSDLLPLALTYEMIRSWGCLPGTRDGYSDFWYDWTVVDGKFLIYFMLYLTYNHLNMKEQANVIQEMQEMVQTDEDIGHKDTCWNLLGWVYQQRGDIEDAVLCFSNSLKFQKQHNAATWHILFLIRGILLK